MLLKAPSPTDQHLDALEENAKVLLELACSIVKRRKKAADDTDKKREEDIALPKEVAV